jgi:small subunit ribosomal protein S13
MKLMIKSSYYGDKMGMSVKKQKGKKPISAKKPANEQGQTQSMEDNKDFRGIVRMSGRDLKGHLKLTRALTSIRGIGQSIGKVIANIATDELKVSADTRIGELSESQIEHLEQIISNIHKYEKVPRFMLNKQKSYQTSEPVHLIGTDLQYANRQDIEHEQDSQSWRGFRHAYGQKVRGQRTRSTGRKGMTMGVMRKSLKAPASAPAKEASKESKDKK